MTLQTVFIEDEGTLRDAAVHVVASVVAND